MKYARLSRRLYTVAPRRLRRLQQLNDLDGLAVAALAQLRAAFHPAAMQFTQCLMPTLVAELQTMNRRALSIASQKNLQLRGLPS